MSQSTHQIAIKGKDQTAGAFSSIQKRASATGAAIRSVMGGAIAAAGAYLSVRAFADGAKELGKLSDLAMKTGTSVEVLTSAATAFQVAGLDVSAESLARSMQYMQKTVGDAPFDEVLKEIAAIPDAAERAQAMMQVFGRGGLELMPLINGGQEAIDKFEALRKVMPSVSSAAADAGDAAADAMTIFGNGAQNLMLKVVGKICSLWGEQFPGGVRASALNAINWLEYAMKKMFNTLTSWGSKIANAGEALFNWAGNGYSWKDAWDEYAKTNAQLDAQLDAQLAKIEADRAAYVENLRKLDVDDLANAFGGKKGASAAAASGGASPKTSNALILGGSNAANRLALLGPQYQNEMKKQTALLEKVAKNTEKTADNADAVESPPVANF